MGRPKLLLSVGNGLLVDHVLKAWTESKVAEVFVIVRKDDERLAEACRQWPVRLVRPETDPGDMKQSIQAGLQFIANRRDPRAIDRCFVAPADLAGLTPTLINRLIAAQANTDQIVLPRFGEREGHPALLPWPITDEVFDLAADEGVDQVVKRHPHSTVTFSAAEIVSDVDTPEEFRQAFGDWPD